MKKCFVLLFLLSSCIADLPSSFKGADSELLETWGKFKRAVKSNDKALLKSISADSIWCSECKDYSKTEATKMDSFLNNHPDKYFNNLRKLNNIEFNRFYSENFRFIFDKNLIDRLDDTSKVQFFPPHKYKSTYEFAVLTIDPDSLYKGFEGYQRVFAFCKTKEEYKFCGVSSVP